MRAAELVHEARDDPVEVDAIVEAWLGMPWVVSAHVARVVCSVVVAVGCLGGDGGRPSPLCARSMKLEAVRGTRSRKSSTLMSPMLVDSVAVGLVTAREGRMAATANMAIWRGAGGDRELGSGAWACGGECG